MSSIFDAIHNNDISTIKNRLANGYNVDAKDELGNTALLEATRYCNLNAMKLLIKNGADVNAQNNSGKTPLTQAIEYRSLDFTTLLVKYGADVNIPNNEGKNALMLAESLPQSKKIVNVLKLTLDIDSLLAGRKTDFIDPSKTELFFDIIKTRALTQGVDNYAEIIKELNIESLSINQADDDTIEKNDLDYSLDYELRPLTDVIIEHIPEEWYLEDDYLPMRFSSNFKHEDYDDMSDLSLITFIDPEDVTIIGEA